MNIQIKFTTSPIIATKIASLNPIDKGLNSLSTDSQIIPKEVKPSNIALV